MNSEKLKEYLIVGLEIMFDYLDKSGNFHDYLDIDRHNYPQKINDLTLSCADMDSCFMSLNSIFFNSSVGELRRPIQEESFVHDLRSAIEFFQHMPEDQTREYLEAFFSVETTSINNFLDSDFKSLNKINHGYWEYARIAYGGCNNIGLRKAKFPDRVHADMNSSGITAFRCWQFSNFDFNSQFFSISLNNGVVPYKRNITKGLKPIQHGAAIGLLSIFSTVLGSTKPLQPIKIYDSSLTRELVLNSELISFRDKINRNYTACVFLVPSHLAGLRLKGFSGNQYEFTVPSFSVNQSFFVVTSAFLGFITALLGKESKVIILSQAASTASLIGMSLDSIDQFPSSRVTFLDLGRVLDLADPKLVSTQHWAKGNNSKKVSDMIKNGIFEIQEK